MANKKPNWTAWVLKFVGSFAYLYVLWQIWAGVSGTFGSILFGLAAVTTVGFFITTLAGLMATSAEMKNWSMRAAFVAGFALIAATMGSGSALVALVGFVLAYIGNGMDRA